MGNEKLSHRALSRHLNPMINLDEKVWYACYGSNLLKERFLCYILGGKPEGAKKTYPGCRDKTLPVDNEDFYICSELYFAKESANWDNGGIAFIRTIFEPQASTLARIYLVTKGQLIDIARQETNTETDLSIDFDASVRNRHYIFKDRSWYGNLVYLGDQRDYPIFTLTNERDLQPVTKPSRSYLQTICRGIREAHAFDDLTILDYLETKKGIAGNYAREELLYIIERSA